MKYFEKSFLITFFILISITLTVKAQVPAPGPPQEDPVMLTGATAHTGNGAVIENAVVAFDSGRLTFVGTTSEAANEDLSGYEQLDMEGKHVYPGFILPQSTLGLKEILAVSATTDHEETGSLNPNVRSLIAYNTDSELIPTYRFNGILMAQIVPRGSIMPGTSSIVQLDAWNWEDAVIKTDDALHLQWPRRTKMEYDTAARQVKLKKNEKYREHMQTLENLFTDALNYGEMDPKEEVNLKLQAMQGLFDGSNPIHLQADKAREIVEGIKFLKAHRVQKIVLVGGHEAHLITGFLKENDIPVIIDNLHRLPGRPEEHLDQPFTLPAQLAEAGLQVGLGYQTSGIYNSRNLPFLAGTAATYGLEKEEALAMITRNNARILGIDDQVGTLETGKQATLFISAGDALDMRGNMIEHIFINGRNVKLEAMQQRLYEKYQKKYSNQ